MYSPSMPVLVLAARWDYRGLFLAGGVLVALVLVGAAVLMLLRRRLRDKEQAVAPEAFTLDDLRRLHRRGLLSDDEYERAKAGIVGRVAATGGASGPAAAAGSENTRSADGTSSS